MKRRIHRHHQVFFFVRALFSFSTTCHEECILIILKLISRAYDSRISNTAVIDTCNTMLINILIFLIFRRGNTRAERSFGIREINCRISWWREKFEEKVLKWNLPSIMFWIKIKMKREDFKIYQRKRGWRVKVYAFKLVL